MPNAKKTPWGDDLFRLFSICLGGAVSFLPATYLVLLLRATSLGLNLLSLTLVWCLLGLILLWEYWKAARINWNHDMNFTPSWLRYVYLVLSTAFIFTLVMMPVTVSVRAYLVVSHLSHSHAPNAFQSLQPLVWTLILLQVLSGTTTAVKFFNDEVKNQRYQRSITADLLANFVCIVLYGIWLAEAAKFPAPQGIIALMLIYIIAEIGFPRLFTWLGKDSNTESRASASDDKPTTGELSTATGPLV